MSREDAHKMLDKILDVGYCGELVLNCFKGNVTTAGLNQVVKSPNEVLMVTTN